MAETTMMNVLLRRMRFRRFMAAPFDEEIVRQNQSFRAET
jgi:hypothetical protein